MSSGSVLLWSLLHAPVFVWFFHRQIASALEHMPGGPHLAMAACLCVEALFLSALLFVFLSPARLLGRAGPFAAALVAALATGVLFIDAHIHQVIGIHINRFILRVMLEPQVFAETGLSPAELSGFIARLGALVAADFLIGVYFLAQPIRVPPVRVAAVLVAIIALEVADRATVAALEAAGGDYYQAAGHVFPLQPPLRLKKFIHAHLAASLPRAPLLKEFPEKPIAFHFRRSPDVVLVLVESLRHDFFEPATMPQLWQRAKTAAVYDRHYASASSTHYSLFSLLFGFHPHRLEDVVGRGESPLIFRALRRGGYQLKLLTASSVNWLRLKQTVFREVASTLDTDFEGDGYQKDDQMLAAAKQFTRQADPDSPIFLMIFFDGSHFPYSFPPEGEVFRPSWDGSGASQLSAADSLAVANRARNSMREVDRKLGPFLNEFSAQRRREALVVVTGDHGESLGERGQFGHGTGVTSEQLHVPMIIWDAPLKAGHRSAVTSHVDLVPTLMSALGDTADPATYSDGIVMDRSIPGRFALAAAGWEAQSALIGDDFKVAFRNDDFGFTPLRISDPEDRPLSGEASMLKLRLAGMLGALQPASSRRRAAEN